MKFYSEKLNQLFDTDKACAEAEAAHDKAVAEAEAKKKALAEERAARAKKVEDLYTAFLEARKAYDEELKKFVKDYGSYHTTIKLQHPIFDLFDGWF